MSVLQFYYETTNFYELSLKVFWVTNNPTELNKHNYQKT